MDVTNTAVRIFLAVLLIASIAAVDAFVGRHLLGQLAFLLVVGIGGLRVWRSRDRRLTDWRYRLALLLSVLGFGLILVMNLADFFSSASALVAGRG